MGQQTSGFLPKTTCCNGVAQKYDYQETPRGRHQVHWPLGPSFDGQVTQKRPKWDDPDEVQGISDEAKQAELLARCAVDNPQGAEGQMQQYSHEWQGAYLIFSEADHGSMYLKWSKEFVEGAIAFFQPATDKVAPSSFKYNGGGQKEILKSKVGTTGQGRIEYYKTWVQFIRECWKFKGVLTVLEAKEVPELKVKVVMLVDGNHKVICVDVDQPVSLEGIHAVVVAQSGTTIFDGMSTMAKNLFIETGHVYGAASALRPTRKSSSQDFT